MLYDVRFISFLKNILQDMLTKRGLYSIVCIYILFPLFPSGFDNNESYFIWSPKGVCFLCFQLTCSTLLGASNAVRFKKYPQKTKNNELQSPGTYHNGAFFSMMPVKVYHVCEGKITDHIAIEYKKRF